MTAHVFLFRAINVGGTARLPMAELRELAAELGASNVSTYIASGNLFATPPAGAAQFALELENVVEKRFGFRREVVTRDLDAVRAARVGHPFEVVNPAYSYVVFLSAEPTPEAASDASDIPAGDDEWRLLGTELHVRYDKGAGKPELNVDRLLRTLGVTGTARNLRTVDELIARLGVEAP